MAELGIISLPEFIRLLSVSLRLSFENYFVCLKWNSGKIRNENCAGVAINHSKDNMMGMNHLPAGPDFLGLLLHSFLFYIKRKKFLRKDEFSYG